ncbi:MAG: orotate phosphoribosyltransferase [Candidatus Dasytiphilus stammeri]
MNSYHHQFINFAIKTNMLKFGNFVLKSGRISPYFFNIGALKNGKDLALLGHFYAQALIESGINFDIIFGPAYKGIIVSITTVIALTKYYNRDISYCFNRKESKSHGEGGLLIGSSLHGHIMLIDDVITSGDTIRQSIKMIKKNKRAKLAGILIALDRQENKNNFLFFKELKQKYNCKIMSIVKLKDLIEYLKLKENFNLNKQLVALQLYQNIYGYDY